jgi:hypothetical protein
MAAIKVYLDEDGHTFIAHALRLRGWEALTTEEAGRRAASDLDQITFAAAHGYTIVTYDIRDFPRLHAEIVTGGGSHGGIIVATRRDPRGNIRALFNVLNSLSPEALINQLLYLTNWL